MLVIAVVLKLARAVSPSLQLGAFHVYKFFSTAVTYPLLFAIGVSLTPWDKLVAAFTVPISHHHRLDRGDDHRDGIFRRRAG